MGNTRRRQVGGRWAGWAAPAPCRPGTRAMGPREAADGVRWPGGWECERCGCARCPRHLSAAAGTATRHPEVRLRRRSCATWLLARSKGGVSAPGLAAQVGVSESTATLVPGRLRGAMARPGCLRRAVGRGRGGRLLRRRARQDEEARRREGHGHAADARGGRAHLGQARALRPQGRPGLRGPRRGGRSRPSTSTGPRTSAPTGGPPRRKSGADGRDASLPTARHVISNLEPWATGTSRGLSTAGLRSLRGRPLLVALASRARRHHGPGRRLLPGALPPRPAARGGLPPAAPAPPGRGRPGGRGEYQYPAVMKRIGEHFYETLC